VPYPNSQEAETSHALRCPKPKQNSGAHLHDGPRHSLSRGDLTGLLAELSSGVDSCRSSSALELCRPHQNGDFSPPPNIQTKPTEHGISKFSRIQASADSQHSPFSWIQLTPDPVTFGQHLLHAKEAGNIRETALVLLGSRHLSSLNLLLPPAPEGLQEATAVDHGGNSDGLGDLSPPPGTPARPLEEAVLLDYFLLPVPKDGHEEEDSGAASNHRSSVSG
jgi:hypothetical protein